MKNIKLLLLGGLDVIGGIQFFIKVIDHEPTLEDKKIFLEETIKNHGNEKNNLFPIKTLKLENIKILDCEDKVVPIDRIKFSYFEKINL